MLKWGNTKVTVVKWGNTNVTKVIWGPTNTVVFPNPVNITLYNVSGGTGKMYDTDSGTLINNTGNSYIYGTLSNFESNYITFEYNGRLTSITVKSGGTYNSGGSGWDYSYGTLYPNGIDDIFIQFQSYSD